jgi:hypothetical protein
VDCNGGTDRIRVVPQTGQLGVGREAQVTTIQPWPERHDAAGIFHGLNQGLMTTQIVMVV